MPDPSPELSHPLRSGTPAPRGRRRARLTVAGVLGAALSPGLMVVPAGAAPVGACQIGMGATADATAIAVQRIDITPLGIAHPTMAGATLLSTRAGITGGSTPKGTALASYLTSGVLDDRLQGPILAAQAQQYAPPAHHAPDVVATPAVDLTSLRLGTGRLSAHATLTDARRCDTTTGPAATATSNLHSADLLAAGDRSLADLGPLSTGTATNLVRAGNRTATLAVASAQIADFTLLGGGTNPVKVHLTSQPVLRATAGGSKADSSVEYTAPVLEVSVPGVGIRRVQGKTGRLALAMPVDAASTDAAVSLARAESMPLLAPDTFPQLLSALGAPAPAAGAVASPGRPGAPADRVAILRISIGALTKEITDGDVHAKAASVRLQLALRTCGPDGYGGKDDREIPIADIDLGVLEAVASAPVGSGAGDGAGGPGGGGVGPSGTGGGGAGAGGGAPGGAGDSAGASTTGGAQPTGGGTASSGNAAATARGGSPAGASRPTAASANLPLTGDRLALIAGIGTLLVLGGRLVMLLARRRARVRRSPL